LVLLEDGVHGLGTPGDHRLELIPVDLLGYRCAGVPDEISGDAMASSLGAELAKLVVGLLVVLANAHPEHNVWSCKHAAGPAAGAGRQGGCVARGAVAAGQGRGRLWWSVPLRVRNSSELPVFVHDIGVEVWPWGPDAVLAAPDEPSDLPGVDARKVAGTRSGIMCTQAWSSPARHWILAGSTARTPTLTAWSRRTSGSPGLWLLTLPGSGGVFAPGNAGVPGGSTAGSGAGRKATD
jgi:hypothetical protein